MDCKASIIITAFQRPHLLKWGLYSLARQKIPFDFETIVVNDGINDETEDICNQYQQKLNIKYIFTGQRNLKKKIKWRVPGFALNIGAQKSAGQILILTCAEMFHLDDTIEKLTNPVLENSKLLGVPTAKDDWDGFFLQDLVKGDGQYNIDIYNNCENLNFRLPFLMSVSREEFFSIGGYDEDLTGIAFDDNDLVDRLLMNGGSYFQIKARTIHLFHPRHMMGKERDPEFIHNMALYVNRRGSIVRNAGRDWGKL